MNATLAWVERGLIGVGTALAIWCAVTIIEAHYFNALPIPPPLPPAVAAAKLPGEAHAEGSRPRAAVEPGGWMARLEAPAVNLSATVLEGTDDGTLVRAAGHIEETAFPGEPGNIGIAGHRDTIFRPVRKLRTGDAIVLATRDRVYRYRITGTTIVDPEDVYVLDPADHPTLTLVTCYPFNFVGHAPRRFIVRADLEGQEARTEAQPR